MSLLLLNSLLAGVTGVTGSYSSSNKIGKVFSHGDKWQASQENKDKTSLTIKCFSSPSLCDIW